MPETSDLQSGENATIETPRVEPITQSVSVEYATPQPNAASRRRLILTLVALAIISITLTIAGFAMNRPLPRGGMAAAKRTMAASFVVVFGTALEAFEVDCGRYPTNAEGLAALITAPANVTNWHGPYISDPKVPADPWGNPYVYQSPADSKSFKIISGGPDGRIGTADDLSR